jgi:predicted nucleic acid-binding Zn ribbon protein
MMLRKALCYNKSFVWLAIMSLTGLPNILHNIQSRTSWQQRCQYLLIVEKWAQALAFERVRLLAKINQLLGSTNSFTIADIHFSTAKWATHQQMLQQSKVVTADHPSYLPAITTDALKKNAQGYQQKQVTKPPETVSEAFQRWQEVMTLRAKQMPKCPRCDRPALIGEISRWQMCRVCAIEHLFN